jgi:hypothetical protein
MQVIGGARLRAMSVVGQLRQLADVQVTSAFAPIATAQRTSRRVSNVPILLQKSKIEHP